MGVMIPNQVARFLWPTVYISCWHMVLSVFFSRDLDASFAIQP